MPRICLFGCRTAGRNLHVFPNPEKDWERFKTWISIVKCHMNTTDDYEFYKTKRICDKHFAEDCKVRNNRLNVNAIPILHLQGPSAQLQITSKPELPPTSNLTPVPSIACPSAQMQITSEPVLPTPSKQIFPVPSMACTSITTVVNMDHDYCKQSSKNSTKYKQKVNLSHKKNSAVHVTKMKTLQRLTKNLRREVYRLRKKAKTYKYRVLNAEKINDSSAFKRVTKNMTMPAKIFTELQIRETSKKLKGRRFKLEEKVLALSLYKKSPKGYPLLSNFFTLPSAKSLKRLLSDIKLKTGINQLVFDKMAQIVKQMSIEDRLCTVIFDEMYITPHINYDASKDELKGLTEDRKIADHALVFMVKAIKANYKQPVAYYYTNALKKHDLKEKIKEVVKAVQKAGLIVLCTICDQSTVNVGAINDLLHEAKEKQLRQGKEWRHDYFEVNNKQIVPLYDVPHLLKGLRNNLLTKKMIYTDFDDNNTEKYVKWEYLQMLYEADKSFGELRCLQKITEEHVEPEKIKKMRVKVAAQTFSHSVAVAAEHLTARGRIPEECRMIIPIFLLIDNLFDSLNVSTYHIPNGKIYKGPIKRNSPHHELWKKAKKTLRTVRFINIKKEGDKVRIVESNTPSVNNFIKTIEGMEVLWKLLSEKYMIGAMLTRHFNQDPVENFFGNIRSLGARNNAPNCIHFESAFKTLLLNNFDSSHSIAANCEKDNNKCLQTLEFFEKEKKIEIPDIPMENITLNEDILHIHEATDDEDNGQRNYVCGWVLSKSFQYVCKACKHCRTTLTGTEHQKNSYIRAKEYHVSKKWLCYPSEEVDRYFHDLQKVVNGVLKINVPIKGIKNNIFTLANVFVDHPFTCDVHKTKLKEFFDNKTFNVIVYSWCRSINRILSGKIRYDGNDEIKNHAQIYHNKRKHLKSKK